MHTTYRSAFTTIRVEGTILPPDLLQLIADGDPGIEGLTPEAYHLGKGEKLNEAISRSWNRLLGAWAAFRAAADKLPEGDPGTSITRERWLLPLIQELGYGRLVAAKALEVGGQSYPISHGWMYTPIHLVGFRVDIDKRTAGVAGAARMSPHSLVQVLLNRSDAHLWAFLSNGLRLRILRDNASLTRQAYVEFDLQAMMDGQAYSDFVLLWLLCHQSRVEANRPEECWLEKWSRMAQQQGTRALDQLRGGVEEAISAFGRGFLGHLANRRLRDELHAGKLEAQDYYRQLLRLVYRLIFLFVAEDRGLLLDPEADPAARDRYLKYYSTARLRDLAARRRGTRHSDLYQGLLLVMDQLESDKGCPELALPALGGFLFSKQAIPELDGCEIANTDLLAAIRSLCLTSDRGTRRLVDYKNLGSEELGSIYESLLELHPILNGDAGTFELKSASGNERKTTGSFYTPTPLINVLLDSALDPVLDEVAHKPNQERAVLALKVCDPASGSGHFLIAAARRIARRLAGIRTGEDEPSPEALRTALRDVIGHCIYGVDINPMAVELCKVNLWMEAQDPTYPLSFLDSHIKCGNSLVGVTPGLDIGEIPDEAFTAVTGDDKPTATRLKKRNKVERTSGQLSLTITVIETPEDLARWAAERVKRLNAMPENNPAEVYAKSEEYQRYLASQEYARLKLEADLWTAAFFWPIKAEKNELSLIAPTQGELTRLRSGDPANPELVRGVESLAERLRVFHWGLEFPEVFEKGGFDCVLSNPPWERIKLQEEEFFAALDPEIATAPNKAARQKLIDALPKKNAALAQEFQDAKHDADATSKFVRESKRFPLTAVGDVNTYAIFAEHARGLLDESGRTGIILPTGIATDDTTKAFFGNLMQKQNLAQLQGFENEAFIFPAVHHGFKFCTVTMTGKHFNLERADFIFFTRYFEQLRDTERHFQLSRDDLALINPNTHTCPVFRTRTDAELTRSIYNRVPVLVEEKSGENPWDARFSTMFHMSNDSGLFETKPAARLVPLYEAKMIWQFDHRLGTYEGTDRSSTHLLSPSAAQYANPRFEVKSWYWVPKHDVDARLGDWKRRWLLVFRDITNSTNERTAIFALIPRVGYGDQMLVFGDDCLETPLVASLVANLNSLVFDYVARQKVGGTHLKKYILYQLPVLPPTAFSPLELKFIAPRVLELVYTAWDLKPFAEDMGYHGEPFRWDEERRALLRAELDAYYARLYGLSRDELRYILDPKEVYGEDFPGETFRVLKDKEVRQFGEYRTRRLVLEKWDEMFGKG